MAPSGFIYVGQWVAHDAKTGDYICSPHPGPVAHIDINKTVDIVTYLPHQVQINLFTDRNMRNRMKDLALVLLYQVIDLEYEENAKKKARAREDVFEGPSTDTEEHDQVGPVSDLPA